MTTALSALSEEQRLEIGCILKAGAFAATYKSSGGAETSLSEAEVSLVSFFLDLLNRLQSQGTVAAMDINKYRSTL